MNERIKQLRKEMHLTQSEFGERIGVKGNTITNYENNLRVPSDALVLSICREFNVNEAWLRTGEGEMFRPVSRDEEISAFTEKVLSSQSSDFKRCFVSALARLDENAWELLEAFALSIVENRNQD